MKGKDFAGILLLKEDTPRTIEVYKTFPNDVTACKTVQYQGASGHFGTTTRTRFPYKI